jgi:hypothetical protein
MRATSDGCVVTCSCGIGIGRSTYAYATSAAGRNSARGTSRIAASSGSSRTPASRAAATSAAEVSRELLVLLLVLLRVFLHERPGCVFVLIARVSTRLLSLFHDVFVLVLLLVLSAG